ncbi:MAG: double zinc ribbon domain-containing protein [Coriobacteriales bacterium]|jgi:predicted amidophosphoribosyltransferase|nr:double zinc ribbon domain-containing protein [Coriobacteriales bacterium]
MGSLLDDTLNAALEAVWPTRCVGCERPGELLCDQCAANLPYIDPRWACPRCGAPFGWLVCSECLTTEGPAELAYSAGVSVLEFRDAAARMVVAYKDKDERRLAGVLAGLLARALPRGWLAWADALTWIPCDRKARERRGFDHMAELAEILAGQTGRAAISLLHKKEVGDQRKLNRQEREENIRASFSVDSAAVAALIESVAASSSSRATNPVSPMPTSAATPTNPVSPMPASAATPTNPGRSTHATSPRAPHLILLDDVLTTGATLHAAASVLLQAGVGEIRVATLARVW